MNYLLQNLPRCLTDIPNTNIVDRGMWKIELTSGWTHDERLYTAKPDDLSKVAANIARYLGLLKASKSSASVEAAYVHKRASRIVTIDRAGLGTLT
jgi:hypothetical protein